MKHLRALALLFTAGWALLPAGSQAQTYPSRPVTLVVPFAAGGATDAIARILNDSMTQSLGQQVVVETVGGAGGMIGAARVARAAPDGYTILLHQVGLAAGMTLYPNPSFDAEKDLTGIGIVNTSSSVIAGRKALPPNNMAELVQWMKQPGQNTRSHTPVSARSVISAVCCSSRTSARPRIRFPYRGGGPALNDLVAGHADLSCLSSAVIEPQVKGGNLKAYGIIGKARFAGLPEVPTWLSSATRTSTSISGTSVRAHRHAAAHHRSAQRRAAPGLGRYEGARRLRQGRHGVLSGRSGNARDRHRDAEERDQALGRRHPRQQEHGAVVWR